MDSETDVEQFYNEILTLLEKLQASELIEEIKQLASRPVTKFTLTTKEKKKEKEVTTRAPTSREKLALALTALVSISEVPLMLRRTRKFLGDKPLKWAVDLEGSFVSARPRHLLDEPRLSSETSSSPPTDWDAHTDDLARKTEITLSEIRDLMKKLALTAPKK
jgi:hypothetical protein